MRTYELDGALDSSNVMDRLAGLISAIKRERRLSLDLSRITWIDSAGLAGLVRLLAEARRIGCEFRLSAASDVVRRALAFARLDILFPLETKPA